MRARASCNLASKPGFRLPSRPGCNLAPTWLRPGSNLASSWNPNLGGNCTHTAYTPGLHQAGRQTCGHTWRAPQYATFMAGGRRCMRGRSAVRQKCSEAEGPPRGWHHRLQHEEAVAAVGPPGEPVAIRHPIFGPPGEPLRIRHTNIGPRGEPLPISHTNVEPTHELEECILPTSAGVLGLDKPAQEDASNDGSNTLDVLSTRTLPPPRRKQGHVHECCMVHMISSVHGDLETFGSSITSGGWENIDRATLLGFTLRWWRRQFR
eukprot:358169-Chlamydomonas_euryale.AAC.4